MQIFDRTFLTFSVSEWNSVTRLFTSAQNFIRRKLSLLPRKSEFFYFHDMLYLNTLRAFCTWKFTESPSVPRSIIIKYPRNQRSLIRGMNAIDTYDRTLYKIRHAPFINAVFPRAGHEVAPRVHMIKVSGINGATVAMDGQVGIPSGWCNVRAQSSRTHAAD